jgi:hypothetical protein
MEPTAEYNSEMTIDSAGVYRFWVTDHAGNTANSEINVVALSYESATGVTTFNFTENGISTDFAIVGTVVKISADLDDHYKDLVIKLNNETLLNGSECPVDEALHFVVTCTPKDYTIVFITGKEAENVKVEEQIITYLHPIVRPLALYHQGYIINNWYTDDDLTELWNFESNLVEDDLVLYAEWQEYRTPTKVKVKIPFDLDATEDNTITHKDPYTITVNYTQNRANDVKVYFGDDSGEFSTSRTTYLTTIEHTYAEPGEYVVEIYGTPHGYLLGGDFDEQAVDPACCVIDIDFA